MSTRGFIGVVRGGQVLAVYCHYDSDPGTMLPEVVALVQRNESDIDGLVDCIFALNRVDDEEVVTDDQAQRIAAAGVDPQWRPRKVWTEVADTIRGALDSYVPIGSIPIMRDQRVEDFDYPVDIEWGYLLNVDTGALEIIKANYYFDMPEERLTFPFDSIARVPEDMLPRMITAVNGTLNPDTEERREGARRALERAIALDRAEGNL